MRFISRFMVVRCRVWKPGVSTNTSCACGSVNMAVIRWRVVWGLRDVMLIFSPDDVVHQRRFPDVGPSDDGDGAGTVRRRRSCAHHAFVRRAGSLLLGAAPARALAFRADVQFRDLAFDAELLLVGFAAHRPHGVAGER